MAEAKPLADDELGAITRDARLADEIDDAWNHGWTAGVSATRKMEEARKRKSHTYLWDYVNAVVWYFTMGLILYTVVLVISAGWHDGKE